MERNSRKEILMQLMGPRTQIFVAVVLVLNLVLGIQSFRRSLEHYEAVTRNYEATLARIANAEARTPVRSVDPYASVRGCRIISARLETDKGNVIYTTSSYAEANPFIQTGHVEKDVEIILINRIGLDMIPRARDVRLANRGVVFAEGNSLTGEINLTQPQLCEPPFPVEDPTILIGGFDTFNFMAQRERMLSDHEVDLIRSADPIEVEAFDILGAEWKIDKRNHIVYSRGANVLDLGEAELNVEYTLRTSRTFRVIVWSGWNADGSRQPNRIFLIPFSQ